MNLLKYKLKISAFITFIIFLLFFITGVGFIKYNEYLNFSNKISILNKSSEKIKDLNKHKLKKLVENINNISVINFISSALSEKNQTTEEIKKLIWVPFLYLSENNVAEFQNFDVEDCNIKFLCKTLNIKDYKFIFAIPKPNQNNQLSIIIFWLFAFLVSLLFFPIIFWIVWKLTKPLEENFEFMKNFINNAWHELKTPLANINLWAQILLQKQTFEPEIIKDIEKESKNLWFIIDSLLELSNINKFQDKQNINLKENIEEILQNYKKDLQSFNLDINLDNIKIYTNPYQTKILIKNLIKNAIKYNNDKKLIKITLKKDFFEIQNSTDQLPNFKKIFDLFYKENNHSEWYWLWLAIVKKITQVNKWKIKNTSEKWLFWIRIYF